MASPYTSHAPRGFHGAPRVSAGPRSRVISALPREPSGQTLRMPSRAWFAVTAALPKGGLKGDPYRARRAAQPLAGRRPASQAGGAVEGAPPDTARELAVLVAEERWRRHAAAAAMVVSAAWRGYAVRRRTGRRARRVIAKVHLPNTEEISG